MKKLLSVFALLLGLPSLAFAQQGVFNYGLKGGFSLSTYAGQLDGPLNAGYKPGFTAGAVATYGLAEHTTVQVEALYSQKGVFVDNYPFRFNNSGSGPQFNAWRYRATLSYLDVPVLAKLTTGAAGTGFFVEVGPQLSLALAQREYLSAFGKVGSYDNPPDQVISTDRSSLVPVSLGYVGGLGYQFAIGLGVGLRYTGDFSHVYKNDRNVGSSDVSYGNSFHNSVFQFQVHYLFGSKS
ncbi:porin family protein [Hymenobacter sp. UV11]|uniref:porin family protein n=1 Tax=Hymenobacter sp. UV11 TaxID=1849735 RepID=UPI001414DEEC|nr:porin family protein [Hymenobacter sp. UV11]